MKDSELITQNAIKSKLPMRDIGAIAEEYFSDVSTKQAKRKLRSEIIAYPDLYQALKETGWSSSKRHFTPLQQRILRKYLG